MKEKVDRILNGEEVDIAEDPRYVLSVSKIKDQYRVGCVEPENLEGGSTLMSIETMKEAGNLLITLDDALERQEKFKDGDDLFFVLPVGGVFWTFFNSGSADHLELVMSGNAFKTRKEARDNIPPVLTKYQELRDKGLV